MTLYSGNIAANILAGADGSHVIQAGETYAPTDKNILAIKINSAAAMGAILDPNAVNVSGTGDGNLNVTGATLNPDTWIIPRNYTGVIDGAYFTSVIVTTGDVVVYYSQQRIS